MLKDRLNQAKLNKDREDLIEEQKRNGSYEQIKALEARKMVEERNKGRFYSATHMARISQELKQLIVSKVDGVDGIVVTSIQVELPVDGLCPETNEPIVIGNVGMIQTKVEFLGRVIEFVPECRANPNGRVRVLWTFDVFINGRMRSDFEWKIDYYTEEKTSLECALRIISTVKGVRNFHDPSEALDLVLEEALLK